MVALVEEKKKSTATIPTLIFSHFKQCLDLDFDSCSTKIYSIVPCALIKIGSLLILPISSQARTTD